LSLTNELFHFTLELYGTTDKDVAYIWRYSL